MENDVAEDGAVRFAVVRATEVSMLTQGTEDLPLDAIFEGSGLALSGGGIRSATFSLGVLQALATRRKLGYFDYLSTVSGGGYIGAWLSAWISRTSFDEVDNALRTSPENERRPEPPQVQWLRRYSNYLTPRLGAFSMDALTVALTWLRNAILNLLILVLAVSTVLLVPKLLAHWLSLVIGSSWVPNAALICAHLLAAISLASMSINLTLRHRENVKVKPKTGTAARVYLWMRALAPSGVWKLTVATGFGACVLAGIGLAWNDKNTFSFLSVWEFFLAMAVAVLLAAVWQYAMGVEDENRSRSEGNPEKHVPFFLKSRLAKSPDSLGKSFAFLIATPAVGVFLGLLYLARYSFASILASRDGLQRASAIIALVPPLVMICFGLSLCIWIGLVGRGYHEDSREWLSRVGAAFILLCAGWFGCFWLALYAPAVLSAFINNAGPVGHVVYTSMASGGWLGSLIGALVLGMAQPGSKSRPMSKARSYLVSFLFLIVAGGVFIAIACSLDGAIRVLALDTASGSRLLVAWLVLALSTAYLAWRVDVNVFSLHDMYKMRLIRCYLGASNAERSAQPFTGFDESDDLPLSELPKRPYHIINTSMNLVDGSQLAWQQRKAASFPLTPMFCGYELSEVQGGAGVTSNAASNQAQGAFRYTIEYATIDGKNAMPHARENRKAQAPITVGAAVATSGAAASPNMGANSQPALAILMTFANIRLGRWSPNTATKTFKMTSPRFGLFYLLKELAGLTNEKSDFVYLSDGGHFDNTGVYELVRRRCRYIVLVDAGADPRRTFEDLGNMVHKCRVDFGVEVLLDLSTMYGHDDGMRCKVGFAAGTVRYKRGDVGKILVIKPSLCVDKREAVDVYNYASSDATFPQQTTLDQWFNESQFEAYRKLGYDTTLEALRTLSDFWPDDYRPTTAGS